MPGFRILKCQDCPNEKTCLIKIYYLDRCNLKLQQIPEATDNEKNQYRVPHQ